VIPHLLRERNWIRQRLPRRDRLDALAKRGPDAVALRAPLPKKDPRASPGVAGLLEIACRKEEDEQVRRLLLAQLGLGDSLSFHGGPHDRSVVPQQTRQDVGAEAALHAPPQVRRALSALSADAVADHALPGEEDVLATVRVARQQVPRRTSPVMRGGDYEERY
jgi:hypothetical protein